MPKNQYNRAAPVHHRVGGWLPKDQRVLEAWLEKKLNIIKQRKRAPTELHPVIQEFRQLIENDAKIFMGFHQMFEQVPAKPPYNNDPTGKPQVRNYIVMLDLFDLIIGEAPTYEDNDLVGFPINAILDWPMGTPGGFTTFINPKVNAMFHKMFNVWSEYLTSLPSRSVLNDGPTGWFGPAATEKMPDFADTFICDPSQPYHGFTSWDDFFTRLFRPGVRPVDFPNNDSIINSACESTVYKIAHDIKLRDEFWIKEEPYSLLYSPVNGKIVKTVNIPGTYYAESPATGFFWNEDGPDPAGPNLSQSFITSIAARAAIYIEADNPAIGLMCFLAIGMAEVSTCEVTVNVGDTVKKGDELGMFHFGGSTHCLIFRPQTKVQFSGDYPEQTPVKLNAAIATVQA